MSTLLGLHDVLVREPVKFQDTAYNRISLTKGERQRVTEMGHKKEGAKEIKKER